MNKSTLAGLFVIAAACCWGVIGLFSRNLLAAGLHSMQISMLRSLVVFVSAFLYVFLKEREKLNIQLRDLWMFLGSGILSIAFFNVCFFLSVEENTLSLAAILLYTAPSFIILISRFVFKELITPRKILALLLAFVGSAFAVGLFSSDITTTRYGLLVGIGSGFGYGLYSIFSWIALRKYHWMSVIVYTFLFAVLVLLPFSRPLEAFALIAHNASALINTLALGWVSTLLPFVLYTTALLHMEVGKASILTFVEPIVATLLGAIVFAEGFTFQSIGGILLILLSILVLNLQMGGRKRPHSRTL